MIKDGRLEKAVSARYAGWESASGQDILGGRVSLDDLAQRVLADNTDVAPVSGRQELLENLVNQFSGG
jgi:xylose isomerase